MVTKGKRKRRMVEEGVSTVAAGTTGGRGRRGRSEDERDGFGSGSTGGGALHNGEKRSRKNAQRET